MNDHADKVVLPDMSACLPQDALTRNFESGKWQILECETEQLDVRFTGYPGYRKIGAEFNGQHAGHLPNKMGVKNKIYKSIQECYLWAELQPSPESHRLAVLICTDPLIGHGKGTEVFHPTDKNWFYDELAPYFDTDVGIIVWEAIRGRRIIDMGCRTAAESYKRVGDCTAARPSGPHRQTEGAGIGPLQANTSQNLMGFFRQGLLS